MQLLIKGKNFEVTDAVRAHVEKKLARLNRYLDTITQTEVEISMEKTKAATDRYAVEVTMLANGTILRGEEKAGDIHSALDSVVDVMQRRLTRFKERVQQRGRVAGAREAAAAAQPETWVGDETEDEAEEEGRRVPKVVRSKMVSVKPMSEEEAAEQMELLGHDFFLFFNATSNHLAVLYRRHNGDYGMIEADTGG